MDIIANGKADLEAAYRWLVSFLPEGEWQKRKSLIEESLEKRLIRKNIDDKFEYHRLNELKDRIGWYLFLAETAVYNPANCEDLQASRILPYLHMVGMNIDLLKTIEGIDKKIDTLLRAASNADSTLFELLIALLWKRNGWDSVEFIPAKQTKQPDIRAHNAQEEWFIEAKRLSTSSEYSLKEREKWLTIWKRVQPALVKLRTRNLSVCLDIVFHVELHSLDDDFAIRELGDKLNFVVGPCNLIDNEFWTVTVRKIDMRSVHAHLARNYVKAASTTIRQLLTGDCRKTCGFNYLMGGTATHLHEGSVLNKYIDTMEWVAAAVWDCDSQAALKKKAKGITDRLSKAIEQLPDHKFGAIHIGIESLDGDIVESYRLEKIRETIKQFRHAATKKPKLIYCHVYDSSCPPNKTWDIQETVHQFGADPIYQPLKSILTVVPEE